MVVADDDRIDGRYLEVHQGVLSLLARQAPVATDLRIVAALLHVIRCVERMGDQCVNIAKLVPLSGHEQPKDAEILEAIERMGALARAQVLQAKDAFATRSDSLARALASQDEEINALNRQIFRRAVHIGDDPDLREWAMFMVLVARCLERVGDNTVDIAEQTVFVITGLFREFADASGSAPRASSGANALRDERHRCAGAARTQRPEHREQGAADEDDEQRRGCCSSRRRSGSSRLGEIGPSWCPAAPASLGTAAIAARASASAGRARRLGQRSGRRGHRGRRRPARRSRPS